MRIGTRPREASVPPRGRGAAVLARLVVLFAMAAPPSAARQPAVEAPSVIPGAGGSFAIVVDAATFAAARDALVAWKDAIERGDRLPTTIVAAEFDGPQAVRDALLRLRAGGAGVPPLEGAVFVGAVPVVMMRDAQHLTSAFKMDQEKFPRRRSSVPTDRWYEDFDLVVEGFEQDEEQPLLFYACLSPDSPQRVEKEIYSARVLPGLAREGMGEAVSRFAAACVRAKEERRPLDHALVVAGHGYHSESLTSWEAQIETLEQALPELARPGGRLDALHHASGGAWIDLKPRVLRALEEDGLDLAVFHAHGETDAQALVGDPPAATVDARLDAIRLHLRHRLRSAAERGQSVADVQLDLMRRHGVPLAWFDGHDDPAMRSRDDAELARRDVHAADLDGLACKARVLVLDSCFNGQFVAEPSIGARYLYGGGDAVAAVGNSVNVLQDLWADEYVGLLGQGVSVGRWHRLRPQLESMLLGDPTFAFLPPAAASPRVSALLTGDASTAREALAEGGVAERELAAAVLARAGEHAALMDVLERDPSHVVRLSALKGLAVSPVADEALRRAVRDPNELVRRFATVLLGEVARPEYAALLLERVLRDPSERVVFNARDGLKNFPAAELEHALEEALAALPAGKTRDESATLLRDAVARASAFAADELALVQDAGAPEAKRIGAARIFRNLRGRFAIGGLLATAADEAAPEALRANCAEALGWFTYCCERGRIVAGLEPLQGAAAPRVAAEARRSLARLRAGPNHALTP